MLEAPGQERMSVHMLGLRPHWRHSRRLNDREHEDVGYKLIYKHIRYIARQSSRAVKRLDRAPLAQARGVDGDVYGDLGRSV